MFKTTTCENKHFQSELLNTTPSIDALERIPSSYIQLISRELYQSMNDQQCEYHSCGIRSKKRDGQKQPINTYKGHTTILLETRFR